MENEIINKMAQLPDRFLAVSFNILFGNEWKSHWDERSKAAEMISILKGNTQPCCPFVKWMQCIAYLMETIKAN